MAKRKKAKKKTPKVPKVPRGYELVTGTVDDFYNSTLGVSELKDEIENWKSGLEGTNLEQSSKYGELEECLSALEEIESAIESIEDTDDEEILQLPVEYMVRRKCSSRADRLSHEEAMFEGVKSALEVFLPVLQARLSEVEEKQGAIDESGKPDDKKLNDEADSLQSRIDDVENIISSIEDITGNMMGVSFPGMY
jgi:chromosome segregation ATPase